MSRRPIPVLRLALLFLVPLLAVAGAGLVLWQAPDLRRAWGGFLLVQASNVCGANVHARPPLYRLKSFQNLDFGCIVAVFVHSISFPWLPRRISVMEEMGEAYTVSFPFWHMI